ncbi:hypothetical protein F7725_022434 [Dissostichus mawsoni]|uniref:HECT domain-containing protein n=1 Tax=Dissostichus mawsoni TaxID=36200 RepID=A0A7J5Z013_DISMA|nr:hypothetical protein F7725_022434 [Dissostichus mawsoni]
MEKETTVEEAALHLLPSLDEEPVGVEGLRIFLILNELLHVIQKYKLQSSTKLSDAVAAAIQSLSAESRRVIGDWWSSLPSSTMSKHVKVWKQALSVILSNQPVPRNSGVRNLVLVLQLMYNDTDYQPLIICNFPFVMDLKSKKSAFDIDVMCAKATDEDKTNCFLFGVLCGLALYNQCIIHLQFPLALFKKLLGVEPTLEDMMEFSPFVGKSLQYILDSEDEEIENLYAEFLINWDQKEVDLDPQNPEKPVTAQNRNEFVEAYVNHAFNTSVEGVFQEFKRGFFMVCDQDLVKLFRPEELQRVLVGQEVYDWAKLKQNTVWDLRLGYDTIEMFWEVFDELTEDQKKDFLWFLTGFRGVPIFGMDEVKMKIQPIEIQSGQTYDQHFPGSLTCHSILTLPIYSSKEIMRDRLTEALLTATPYQ